MTTHLKTLPELVLAAACLWLSVPVASATGQLKPESVAFCYFTTNSHSYLKQLDAEQFADLVQANLLTSSSVNWVERSNLDAALREFEIAGSATGPRNEATILHLGRWLRADMLIKGTISEIKQKPGESISQRLKFEVIDLARADVLVAGAIDLRGTPDSASVVTAANANRAAAAITRALDEALRVRRQMAGQVLVAPLYFANANSTGRLDFFEADLQKQLAARNMAQRRVRYLQFPRSEDAIEEANLIATGIVANDNTAGDSASWQRVADYYVWGTFDEVNSSGVPFDDVQVKLILSIWDGRSPVTQIEDQATVRELSELAARAAAAIEGHAKAKSDAPVDENLRRKTAADLARRAKDLQEWVVQVDIGDFGRPSGEWLRLWRQCIRILSVAAFFDPTNETIRRELLIETTRDDLAFQSLPGNLEFRRLLNRSDAWREHCDQFGYDYRHIQSPRLTHRPGLSDNRVDATTALTEFVDAAADVQNASYGERSAKSNEAPPHDTPTDLIESTQRELSREYLDRLKFAVSHAPETIAPFAKQYFRDCLVNLRLDDLRAEAIALLWPLLLNDPTFKLGPNELRLRNTFIAVGRPEVADRLIAAASTRSSTRPTSSAVRPQPPAFQQLPPQQPAAAVPISTRTSPAHQIAPLANAPMRAISLDKHFYPQTVTALTFADGKLWIGVNGQARSLEQGYALFRSDLRGQSVEPVRTMSQSKPQVTAFAEVGKGLWLALDGEGILEINPATTKAIDVFGQRDGLPTQKIFALAECGDFTYAGGGQEERGALGLYDRKRRTWSQLALPQRETASPPGQIAQPNVAQITRLACDREWLALYAHYGGCFTSLLVKRHADQRGTTERWLDVGDRLRIAHPELSRFPGDWRPSVNDMLWHDGLLWIAASRGLIAFDPKTKRFPVVLPTPLELTAIERVGNRLWLSANPFDPGTNFSKSDAGACLLSFNPAKRTWDAQILVPHTGQITALVAQGQTLWCGMAAKDATVVAVDVSSIAPAKP